MKESNTKKQTIKNNYILIFSISSRLIHAHALPYHVLSIAKGVIFFGCFKKIRIQYFLAFAQR